MPWELEAADGALTNSAEVKPACNVIDVDKPNF